MNNQGRFCFRWKPVPPHGRKAKARLVLQGFRGPRLSRLLRDAPVATKVAVALVLQMAASMNWHTYSGDCKAAFLQGKRGPINLPRPGLLGPRSTVHGGPEGFGQRYVIAASPNGNLENPRPFTSCSARSSSSPTRHAIGLRNSESGCSSEAGFNTAWTPPASCCGPSCPSTRLAPCSP